MVLTDLVVAGDAGSISATSLPGAINNYQVGGNLTGSITLLKRKTSPGFDQLVSMQVTGNMLGDGPDTSSNWLYTINQIEVGGNIGASGLPVTINSRNGINRITSRSMYANINGNAYPSSGGANYFQLIATLLEYPSSPSSNVGVISGSIIADTVEQQSPGVPGGIFTTGDFAASLTLSQPLDGNVIVSRALTGSITLPAMGLAGQIVTNNFNNAGAATSFWSGSNISIGGSPLTSTPYYTNAPASIGGGSVGAIGASSGNTGFRLHNNGCAPVNGTSVIAYGIDRTSIIVDPPCTYLIEGVNLRFYGPVDIASTQAPNVTVEYLNNGVWTSVPWTPVVTRPANRGNRVLTVTNNGSFLGFGTYRIKPVAGKILSENVGYPTHPEIAPFEYTVTLVDGCGLDLLQAFDLDHSGDLGMGDVAAWLGNRVDLNRDAEVNTTDLQVLLGGIGTAPNHPLP